MSSNRIELIMTSDDRDVLRMFQKQQAEILKNQRGLLKMGQSGRNAGRQISSGIGSAVVSMKQFIGAVSGVGSVIGLVALAANRLRAEWENLKRQQGEAGQVQITVATAQKAALENLDLTEFEGGIDEVKQRVSDLSVGVVGGEATIWDAVSRAASFKGQSLTGPDAFEAIEVAKERFPESPDALNTETQAILTQKKVTPEESARDIEGFFIAAKQASPVVDNAMFAGNVAPAIAQLQALGDTADEAGALVAALGQGINDSEGRVTANAAVNLSKRLKEALPNIEGGAIARLRFLQTEEGRPMQKKLLGPLAQEADDAAKIGLPTEAKAFTSVMGLISDEQTKMKQLLEDSLKSVPQIRGAEFKVDQVNNLLKAEPIQQNAAMNRLLESTAGTSKLENVIGGRGGITREGFDKVLDAAGLSLTGRQFALAKFEFGSSGGTEAPIKQMVKQLREEANRRVDTTHTIPSNFPGGQPVTIRRPVSEDDLRVSEGLNRAADRLEQFKDFAEPKQVIVVPNPARAQAQAASGAPANANQPVPGAAGAATGDVETKAALIDLKKSIDENTAEHRKQRGAAAPDTKPQKVVVTNAPRVRQTSKPSPSTALSK